MGHDVSTGGGGGVSDHTSLTGVTANQHHNQDHASRHASGQADAVKIDDLAAGDDNTDLNASTSKHGLLPKLSGVASEYLSGTGVFSTPSGGQALPAQRSALTSGNVSVTATSFADVTGITLSIVKVGSGPLLIGWAGGMTPPGGGERMGLDLHINGARRAASSDYGMTSSNNSASNDSVGLSDVVTGLAPGTYTLKLQARVSGGTGTVLAGTTASAQSTLWAIELPETTTAGIASLTSVEATLASDQTGLSNDSAVDVNGCSVTLAAGTWLVGGQACVSGTAGTYAVAQISEGTSGNGTKLSQAEAHVNVAGRATCTIAPRIVSLPSGGSYHLRAGGGSSPGIVADPNSNGKGTYINAVRVGSA